MAKNGNDIPMHPRPKLYKKLRARMVEAGCDGGRLAELVGITKSTLSRKLCGHLCWTLDEAYRVLAVLRVRPELIGEYFPPEGRQPSGD